MRRISAHVHNINPFFSRGKPERSNEGWCRKDPFS